MAIEGKRGCGYRKVGGLYMMGGRLGLPCCKMPIPLHVCPTCSAGVKQTRGWTWIDPKPWLAGPCHQAEALGERAQPRLFDCPAASGERMGERAGLLWIGAGFYPSVEEFIREANAQGISRRITAIPRDFKLGETWVFLAHPRAIPGESSDDPGQPGIFRIFMPTAIEKVVTQTQSEDAEEMAKLDKAGITPFVVPDDDKDHQGSVYDKPEDEPEAASPGLAP